LKKKRAPAKKYVIKTPKRVKKTVDVMLPDTYFTVAVAEEKIRAGDLVALNPHTGRIRKARPLL